MTRKLMVAVLCMSAAYAQSGTTGLSFLKLGISARSVAMGDAYTAVYGDHSASFYNPASLGFAGKNEILLMHKNWIAETNTEYLGATILGNEVNAGISLLSTSVNDIEIRLIPGDPVGTFSARNISFGGTIAIRSSDNVSFGASGKMVYEKIFTDEATGYGIDVGALYKIDEHSAIGASILNIGSMSVLRAEPTKLPTSVRIGGSYAMPVSDQFFVTAAMDGVKTLRDSGMHVHLGGEISYQELMYFRAGYQTGYEFHSLSVGAGVTYTSIRFDYAFVPFTGAFNSTHTFSLSFLL